MKATRLVKNVIAEDFLPQNPLLVLHSSSFAPADYRNQVSPANAIGVQLSVLVLSSPLILVGLSLLRGRLPMVLAQPNLVILFSVCILVGYVHQLAHGSEFYPAQFQLTVLVLHSLLKSKDGSILRYSFHRIVQLSRSLDILTSGFLGLLDTQH